MWARLLAVPLTVVFAYFSAVFTYALVQGAALHWTLVPLLLMAWFSFDALLGQIGYLSNTPRPLRDRVPVAFLRVVILWVLLASIHSGDPEFFSGAWTLRIFAVLLMGSVAVAAALATSRFYNMQEEESELLGWFSMLRPALVPACGAICYWRGLFGSIQEFIFITYLMVGFQNSLTGMLGALQHMFTDARPEALVHRHLLRLPARGLFLGLVIGVPLAITQAPIQLASVLLWPFSWLFGALFLLWKRPTDRASMIRFGESLVGPIYFPIATIFLLSLLYVVSFAGWPDAGYLWIVLVLVLITTSWRHLSYLLLSLPWQLRRGTASPYRWFILIVFTELAALLLALAPIALNKAPSAISFDEFRGIAYGFFRYADWTSWLARGFPEYGQLLTAGAGLAFNLGVAGSLVRFGQFRRTRAEIEHQAFVLARNGDYEGARKMIRQFSASSAESLMVEGAVSVAKGDPSEAAEHVRNFIRLHRQEPNDSRVFFLLANLAQAVEADCEMLAQIFKFAKAHKVPDGVCAFLAGVSHARGCAPLTVLGAEGSKETAARLLAVGMVYPVTLSAFSQLYDMPALKVFSVLAPKAGERDPLSIIGSRCLRLLTLSSQVSSLQEYNRKLDSWLDENQDDVDKALNVLTDKFELAVASQYLAMVQAAVEPNHPRGVSVVERQISSVRERVKGDTLSETMVNLTRIMK